jgi:ribosome biogenesis protein BMS1
MEQTNKVHRKSKDDNKSSKKKLHVNGHNAKAFAVAAPGRLERQARRTHDVTEKKFHVPMVDRTPDEPPPVLIAVVGPAGVSMDEKTH